MPLFCYSEKNKTMAKSLIAQIAARAKQIRSANPKLTWQSALKKAGAEYKGTKQTTSKRRVGVVARTKKGAPSKRLKKAEREYNSEVDAYKYFVVDAKTGRVHSGWEYKSDAKDAQSDFDRGETKIITLAQLKKSGKDPRGNWKYQIGKTKRKKRVVSGSAHKDNKSHNVSIRVVSGTKRVKTVRPKITKSDIDLSKLNGILKLTTGKYFEVAGGANKGSVFYIQSTKKATKETKKTYNVKFWEYRSGRLSKPFLATISDAWINKRSIRPRSAVRSSECIGFAL